MECIQQRFAYSNFVTSKDGTQLVNYNDKEFSIYVLVQKAFKLKELSA